MSHIEEGDFFTLVFEGDIRKFQGDPLLTDTPFGRPIAVSVGNALDELEQIESEAEDHRWD